jgi:hypothetical protein
MAPALRRWLSAEKTSSSPFWMMMESPKGDEKRRQNVPADVRLRRKCWQRIADEEENGAAINVERKGSSPMATLSARMTNAESTMKSPCLPNSPGA